MSDPTEPSQSSGAPQDRRDFIKSAACAVLGGACVLAPVGAGVLVVIHPLALKGPPVEVRLATLDALPIDGPPRLFQVVTDRRDAWTQFPKQPVGAVFLIRKGEREIVAFNASCPHLGCAVEFRDQTKAFYCPCHDSTFARTGEVVGKSPSLRGLDTLEVEIRENDIWVKFLNFETGIAEKKAIA